jgi:hypothetical protein
MGGTRSQTCRARNCSARRSAHTRAPRCKGAGEIGLSGPDRLRMPSGAELIPTRDGTGTIVGFALNAGRVRDLAFTRSHPQASPRAESTSLGGLVARVTSRTAPGSRATWRRRKGTSGRGPMTPTPSSPSGRCGRAGRRGHASRDDQHRADIRPGKRRRGIAAGRAADIIAVTAIRFATSSRCRVVFVMRKGRIIRRPA